MKPETGLKVGQDGRKSVFGVYSGTRVGQNSLGAWGAVYRVGLKRLATATPTAAPARRAGTKKNRPSISLEAGLRILLPSRREWSQMDLNHRPPVEQTRRSSR